MKLAIALLAVVTVASAQRFPSPFQKKATLKPTPKPFKPIIYTTAAPPAYSTFAPLSVKYYKDDARFASTLREDSEVNPDGTFNWFFETDNGIAAQAQGGPKYLGGNPPETAEVVQGSFSWVSPNGEPIDITYVADENGYQPTGNAIPTPPPIPPLIARALEYIRQANRQK